MSRDKGTFNFAANFEPLIKSPLDARGLVALKSDLTDPSIWADANGNYWIYNGMPVVVNADTSINNGMYYLANVSTFTNISSWTRVGSDASIDLTLYATNASVGLALGPYATNSSVGLALGAYATNASISLAGFATNTSVNNAFTSTNASFGAYATNASVGLALGAYTTNVSVNLAFNTVNASIIRIDGSTSWWRNYVDGSFATRDASELDVVDALTLFYTKSYIDGSYYTKSHIDSSFARVDACLNNSASITSYVNTSSYYDGSLNNIRGTYIKSTSTGVGLYWNAGLLDVSVAGGSGISQAYVDGSLAKYIKSTSIGIGLYWNAGLLDVSVEGGTGATTLAALTDVSITAVVDKSFLQYESSTGKWKNIVSVEASLYFWPLSTALVKEASLSASMFKWNGAYLEPSVAGGTTTNAWNGLTKTDNSIGLGGTISDYTTIDISNYAFTMQAGQYGNTQYNFQNGFITFATEQPVFAGYTGYFAMSTDNMQLTTSSSTNRSTTLNIQSHSTYFSSDASAIIQFDSSGAKYLFDLSSTFVDRSLVDKGYVKTQTGAKTFQTLTINVSTAQWNVSTGYNAKITLTTNTSLNISCVNGDTGTLIVKQDASGSRLLELPTPSLKNGAWILSNASDAIDIISFIYDGSTYYWNKGGAYA